MARAAWLDVDPWPRRRLVLHHRAPRSIAFRKTELYFPRRAISPVNDGRSSPCLEQSGWRRGLTRCQHPISRQTEGLRRAAMYLRLLRAVQENADVHETTICLGADCGCHAR